MTKTAFFINPLSYTIAKHGSILGTLGSQIDVKTYSLDPFSLIDAYITDIAKQGVNLVFIEGGDGTIHGVVSAILAQKSAFKIMPKIALLPGGMTNLIAKQFGIKRPNSAKIKKLINSIDTVQPTHLPLIKVGLPEHETEQFGFLFSTGALPVGTRYCVEKVHTKGITGEAAVRKTLAQVLLHKGEARDTILAPTQFTLDIAGEHLQGNHIISIASTLPKLMVGLSPFWGKEDAPLHITYVKEGARKIIKNVTHLLRHSIPDKRAQLLAKDGFRSWSVNGAIIHHSGPIVLDGEFLKQTNGPIHLSATLPLAFVR